MRALDNERLPREASGERTADPESRHTARLCLRAHCAQICPTVETLHDDPIPESTVAMVDASRKHATR